MFTYQNPIIKGFHPDPSICKDEHSYYLVTSSFEFLPGVPLFKSQDLINWQQIGHCLTRDSQIDLHGTPVSGGIFAPTIRYHQGTFYMITTNITKGNFIVSSKNPEEGFSNPVWLDIDGIDPSLYFENDKVYVQNVARDASGISFIQQSQIDIHTGKILSGPSFLSKGCGGRDAEAPHLYKINGWYYLFLAEGGTREGHMVTVQRSRNLDGPYEISPYHPMVSNRDKAVEPLQSVGHADLIQDGQGQWWIVCLATRPNNQHHHLGRETILLPVEWTEDGWPVVPGSYARETITINREIEQKNDSSFDDCFESAALRYDYNTIRDFLKENIDTSIRGQLKLTGNGSTLLTADSPLFVGVRQTENDCVFETEMTLPSDGSKAGLSVYIDNLHHMEIGITNHHNNCSLYVKKNVEDLQIVSQEIPVEGANLTLGIEANKDKYTFYYLNDQSQKIIVDTTSVRHLTIEASNSPFTGVYGGMFIEGDGQVVFQRFSYHEKQIQE